jgi:hypothetical protein
MPISDLSSFRARLSYDEIASYTKWSSNVMINDYLGITASSAALIDLSNQNEIDIKLNKTAIEFNFQYLHGSPNYSNDYAEAGTAYAIGDLVSESGNEYAAKVAIADPPGVFNPSSWDRVSTTDNYIYLKDHEAETVAHGSTGDIVGNADFCTELIGGVVLLIELVADAVDSTAEVTLADLGTAPATYNQGYNDSQTNLINDVKAKHNTMLTDLNNAIAQINDIIAKSKTAKQMAT